MRAAELRTVPLVLCGCHELPTAARRIRLSQWGRAPEEGPEGGTSSLCWQLLPAARFVWLGAKLGVTKLADMCKEVSAFLCLHKE